MREEAIGLLTQAAEFEHGVCCAYLYAAFSLRRSPEEGLDWRDLERNRSWAATLMNVAREEMGHLGTVSNLLLAVGGTPHYVRSPFPFVTAGMKLELAPLSASLLHSFVLFESGEGVVAGGTRSQGVGALYGRIKDVLAQMGDKAVFPTTTRQLRIRLPTAARIGFIDDLSTAMRAIDSVVADGDTGPGSHFARLSEIEKQAAQVTEQIPFTELCRPLAENPSLESGPGRTLVCDPGTRRVLELFESSYSAMLLMLSRLTQDGGESPAQADMLARLAYYPFMTMVVRPLGELLTLLALGDGSSRFAGPSFATPGQVSLPHEPVLAWSRIEELLDDLVSKAAGIVADRVLADRGEYVLQSLTAMRNRVVEAKVDLR